MGENVVPTADGSCNLYDPEHCVGLGLLCGDVSLHDLTWGNNGWSGNENTSFYNPPDVVTGQLTLNQGVFVCLARTYKNQSYKHGGLRCLVP